MSELTTLESEIKSLKKRIESLEYSNANHHHHFPSKLVEILESSQKGFNKSVPVTSESCEGEKE